MLNNLSNNTGNKKGETLKEQEQKKVCECLLSIKCDINCLQNQITDLGQSVITECVISDRATVDSIGGRTAEFSGGVISNSVTAGTGSISYVTSDHMDTTVLVSNDVTSESVHATCIDTEDATIRGALCVNQLNAPSVVSSVSCSTCATVSCLASQDATIQDADITNVTSGTITTDTLNTNCGAITHLTSDTIATCSFESDEITQTSYDNVNTFAGTTCFYSDTNMSGDITTHGTHYDTETRGIGTINVDPNIDLTSQWVTIYIPVDWENSVTLFNGQYTQDTVDVQWSFSILASHKTAMIAWDQSALEAIKEFSFDKETGAVAIKVFAQDFINYHSTSLSTDDAITTEVMGPGYETIYTPETLAGYLFESYNDDTVAFYFGGQVKLHSLKAEIQNFDWATYKNIGIQYNLRVPVEYDTTGTVKEWQGGKEGQYLTVRPKTYNGTTVNQLVWEDWIDQTEGTVVPQDTLITAKTLAFYDGTSTGSGQEWDPTITGGVNLKEALFAAGTDWLALESVIDDQLVLTTNDISYYSGWKMVIGGATVASEGKWTSAVISYPPNTLSSKVWLYVYNDGKLLTSKQLGSVEQYKVNDEVTRVAYNGIEEIQFKKTADGYSIKNLGDGTITHGDHSVAGDLKASGSIYNDYISAGERDTTDQVDGSLVIQPSREYFYVSVTNTNSYAATLEPFSLRPKTDFSYGSRVSESKPWRWANGISNGNIQYGNVYYISYYNGTYYVLNAGASATNGRAFEITKLEWDGTNIRLRTAKETAYKNDYYTSYSTDYDYTSSDAEWADIWAAVLNPQAYAVTGTIDNAYIDGDISIFKKSTVDGVPTYNNVAIYDDAESTLENGKPVIYKADNMSLQTTDTLSIDNASIDDLTVDTIHARQGYFTKVTTTEEETISTGSDNIVLRQNNSTKLKDGQLSGVVINNYDGEGKVAVIGTDNDGTVRVGTAETATHSFDEIYYKNGKYYTYDDDTYTEVTVNGELVAFESKSINEDDYTKYVNAVFAVFGTANTVPLAARDEDSNMADQALTIWDADTWTFKTIARPTTAESVLVPYFDANNVLRYRWDAKKPGVYTFATKAEYMLYAASNNIPNDSIITITGENNYIFSEDK